MTSALPSAHRIYALAQDEPEDGSHDGVNDDRGEKQQEGDVEVEDGDGGATDEHIGESEGDDNGAANDDHGEHEQADDAEAESGSGGAADDDQGENEQSGETDSAARLVSRAIGSVMIQTVGAR